MLRWVSWSGSVGAWSLGVWGLRGLVRSPGGRRDEEVIMAVVAPIEVGASGPVPNFDLGVVRSVNDDGVMVSSCKHMSVLLVSPFAVCT